MAPEKVLFTGSEMMERTALVTHCEIRMRSISALKRNMDRENLFDRL